MTSAAAPPPKLVAARAQVLELVAAAPATPRRRRTIVRAAVPVAAPRSGAPRGARAMRPGTRGRGVLSAAIALLDAAVLVVAIMDGNTLIAILAGALFVFFGLMAFGSRRRPANSSAQFGWRSPYDWSGPWGNGAEFALLRIATDAAERIGADPVYLAKSTRPDLGTTLDEIDQLNYAIARARVDDDLVDVSDDERWSAAVDRVAAMFVYVDTLAASRS